MAPRVDRYETLHKARLEPPLRGQEYELDPEVIILVMHLSLRNKQKTAKLHSFENCKLAYKLRN